MTPRLLGRLVVLACALIVGEAAAQSAHDVKEAEDLFQRGSRLFNAGRYEEACPDLEAAQRLVAAGIGVTLYLGDCYEQTGRLKSAWDQFKKAERIAGVRNDPRGPVARERAEALWPRLAKLKVVVAKGADCPGLVLTDDGVPIERSDWGQELPVDPRTHHVRAQAPQHDAWELAIDIPASAGTISVQVAPLKEAAGPSARQVAASSGAQLVVVSRLSQPPLPPPPLPPSDRHPLGAQRIAAIATLGAGVVAVGIGAVFGLEAKSKEDASNSNGQCLPNDHCNGAGLAERSDALTAATISSVGFVAGAACLVGGAVLYLTAPTRSRERLALTPRSERGGASVLLEGRW